MKKMWVLCAVLLLAGCGDQAAVEETATTNEESVETVEVTEQPEEATEPEIEVARYSEGEVEEFKFALLTASKQAIEYLSNTRSDIYICGKICDNQPLTDIQLSMDVSRSGLQRSADGLLNLVPQIREVAALESPSIDAADMKTVADQFEAIGNAISALLTKTDWTSWDEPRELIDGIITDLDEVSLLYKPYSPGVSADEGADMEAEMNISSAIIEIMYARDELQTLYNGNVQHLRNEPYEEDGALGRASAYYFDHADQYIDSMIRSADLALEYPMDEPLKQEFTDVKVKAEQLRQAITEYNGLVTPYQDAYDYETLLARWNDINKAMDLIEDGLYLPMYQMEIYQDFVN